ncbi:MAG: alpha/beta fold hydrolase [Clostridia bacterium]|nr:alpha/beta fold hydrolase [Clostridia bacterium]
MENTFIKNSGTFESSDSENNIVYYVWTPIGNPRAVVQIVHGMCEHMERYEEFARFLTSKGIVVCGHDQLGHGHTARSDEDLGFFAPSDGDKYLLEDVEKLRLIMRKKYRRLPYFLLGHSFGSFVARAYASAYPEDSIDALILSGTCGDDLPAKAGKIAAKMIAAFRGKRYRSPLLFKLAFGGYNKRFADEIEESKGCAWVTTDKEVLDKYINDKFCTFRFTTQAYHDMFMLIEYNKEHIPPCSLPVYIFSGSEDPVGDYGQGVSALYEKYFDAEISDVTLKIYEDERHEVLTGVKRLEAFDDLSAWIDRIIDAKVELMAQSMRLF